jgi:hypothetical protein
MSSHSDGISSAGAFIDVQPEELNESYFRINPSDVHPMDTVLQQAGLDISLVEIVISGYPLEGITLDDLYYNPSKEHPTETGLFPGRYYMFVTFKLVNTSQQALKEIITIGSTDPFLVSEDFKLQYNDVTSEPCYLSFKDYTGPKDAYKMHFAPREERTETVAFLVDEAWTYEEGWDLFIGLSRGSMQGGFYGWRIDKSRIVYND